MKTKFQLEKKEKILKNCINYKNDTHKKERLNKGLCIYCFYNEKSVMAGRAITHKNCESCNENQIYNSTYTDNLCLKCSKEFHLCKHCGCEVNYKKI